MKILRLGSYLLGFIFLQGCEQSAVPVDAVIARKVSPAEIEQFFYSVKRNLVFVAGGKFLMGDFGLEHAPERMPYDADKDSKPLHEVELSSYSIGKFKVTNSEYQFYLKVNGLNLRENGIVLKKKWDIFNALPDTPAHVDWYEADQYCTWLAAITKVPFSLPTEAQWEYAARSRGQFLMVATNDGTYKAEPYALVSEAYDPKGINISSRGNRVAFAQERGWGSESYVPLPVDMFPPNPLGLFSMTDNGYEWVKDWYDPSFYAHSPLKDPQGPSEPLAKDQFGRFLKVARGQGYADPYWGGGVNVHRTETDPFARVGEKGRVYLTDKTVRCVVNSPTPVAVP